MQLFFFVEDNRDWLNFCILDASKYKVIDMIDINNFFSDIDKFIWLLEETEVEKFYAWQYNTSR